MENKFFPIKTATACQLKWTWSTIFLYSGRTESCHRASQSTITPDTFDSFHNTPRKIEARKLMLDGLWPSGGCEYCRDIEYAGGKSDRQFQLEISNLVPPELEQDPIAVSVSPRILEVYLNNICNMSCIYCWDGFSSRIQSENKKFGRFEKNGVVIDNQLAMHPEFDQITEKFWQWMEKNYHTLRRFHILGGEPFFQPEFDRVLDFLESHNHPDLEFNIVSNLKVPETKLHNFIERIKKLVSSRRIGRFDLTASIDCWGKEQEYIRYGINMLDWQKNFNYLVDQKWITLNINQTITVLGIKSMPDLIDYINDRRQKREINHYFMACVNRPVLYPGIIGADFFKDDFTKILKRMPETTWQYRHAKDLMRGLETEFNTKQRDNDKINKLIVFLDEIDRRRNLNWRKTFPWLNDVV